MKICYIIGKEMKWGLGQSPNLTGNQALILYQLL